MTYSEVSQREFNKVNTKDIVALLKESVQVVTFTKINGDKRIMTCTLMEEKIPPAQKGEALTQKKVREYNDAVCVVFDVKAKGFRSFRVANVVSIDPVATYKEKLAAQQNLNWDGE